MYQYYHHFQFQITRLQRNCLVCFQQLHHIKRSIFSSLFCLPTSLVALLLFLLLFYNGFTVFYLHLPFPSNPHPEPANFSHAGNSLQSLSSAMMYAVQEDTPPVILKTLLPLLQIPINHSVVLKPKQTHPDKAVKRLLRSGDNSKQFRIRIRHFFGIYGCKVRFFMTWISSLKSFGERELFAVESLFKSHPKACLVIVSSSMDSESGNLVLKRFFDKGFKLMAIKPDFDYILKDTHGGIWLNRLKKGSVSPGEVSLGQNMSNLLRLALLYKFGGVYMDTDVIVLKRVSELRNCIGAQTVDLETGKWSRLNNAVLIFDKNHPLVFKFIEEFALTFDGNKWGHNGPYLVSRVVSRVEGKPEFSFTVLPPSAFYPVNWSRITSLFRRGPADGVHQKWLHKKLEQIQKESFTLHLWNKQSRKLKVEGGSIVNHIMLDRCIFCNSSI